jgi:hypothetical protein
MATDPADGGFASRKFILTLITQGFMFLGVLIAVRWTGVTAMFETLVGGLTAALAIYLGGNVSAKWAIGKNLIGLGKAENMTALGDAPADSIPQNVPREAPATPAPAAPAPQTLSEMARAQDGK